MNISSSEKIKNDVSIEFHGTNGWFETESGCTSCIGVYTNKCVILFDIGTGFKNVSPTRTKGKPLYLFVSHLHFDHIYGIHLLGLHSPTKLKIFLPQELKKEFMLVTRSPFVKCLNNLGFPVEICGVDTKKYHEEYFEFEALDLEHNTITFGYKIQVANKSICYCVDTKVCDNVYKISKDSDVFICDSALINNESTEDKFHLNMHEAAHIAKSSKVKLLVLTHFGALRYKTLQDRFKEAKSIETIFKSYIIGTDHLIINF